MHIFVIIVQFSSKFQPRKPLSVSKAETTITSCYRSPKKQKERKHRKQARNKRPSPFSHTHNLWRRTDRPSPETATDGSYFKFQLRLSRTRTAPLPLSQVENLFRFSHHVALKMACRIFPVFRVNRAGTEPAICYFSCFLCV